MVSSGSLSVLLCTVLVVLAMSGSETKNEEKLAMCCTAVSNKEIKEPILGYIVQRANRPCVNAVIFQTQSGLFCVNVRAPWVRAKIVAFEKAKGQLMTASEVSS